MSLGNLVKGHLFLKVAFLGCCRLPWAGEGPLVLNPHRQPLEEHQFPPPGDQDE